MKYLKNNLSTLAILVILALSSCNQDRFYEDDFGDQFTEQNDDGSDGGFDQDNGDEEETEGALTLYAVENGELRKIKDFSVKNNLKAYQQDIGKHMEMWAFYKNLIPENQLHFVKEFEVFYGGNSLAGYVVELEDGSKKWRTGLAIDLADNLNESDLSSEFAYTCIHEFGHILTLNETQMANETGGCSTFQPFEGCTNADAYINELYNIGWKDIYAEHQRLDEDDIFDFYSKYQNRFVTDYAATNPGEDIAEVFTHFVIEDNERNGNTIAAKKIQAMYDRPELIELRRHMRNTPDVLALSVGDLPKLKCNHKKHNSKRVEIKLH